MVPLLHWRRGRPKGGTAHISIGGNNFEYENSACEIQCTSSTRTVACDTWCTRIVHARYSVLRVRELCDTVYSEYGNYCMRDIVHFEYENYVIQCTSSTRTVPCEI